MRRVSTVAIVSLFLSLSAKAGTLLSDCTHLVLATDHPEVSRTSLERLAGSTDLDFFELEVSDKPVHVNRMAQISVIRQRESHLALRAKLREQTATVLGIRKMFYPASGVDSATPFMILPDLRTVLAFDENLFAHRPKSLAIRPDFGPSDAHRGFTWVGNFKSYDDLADLIVGRILVHVPNARIRRVVAFGPRVQNRVSNYLHLPHGFVLFDQGEGTPQRSYIHFSEASGSGTVRPRSSTNILERLSHEPFDAVLRKGAMDFFDSVETQAEIQRLMVNLISRQGLWIDGDSMESDGENISVRRKNLPQLLDSWGLRLQIQMNRTQIEGFGYGLVEFVRFKLTH